MEFIYMLLSGSEWEDAIIYLNKEQAISASIQHPNQRVEIFALNADADGEGYAPTYDYYQQGNLVTPETNGNNVVV